MNVIDNIIIINNVLLYFLIHYYIILMFFILIFLHLLFGLLLEHNALSPVFQNFQIRFQFTRRKATVVISEKF